MIELGFTQLSAGPVFAGERVAWIVDGSAPGEFVLHHARFDGSDRRSVRLSIPPGSGYSVTRLISLDASDRRWAVHALVYSCANESGCKYQFHDIHYSAILSAPLGEVPEPIAGCTTGGAECRPCSEELPVPDVDGDVVAFSEPCRRGVATVRDFAPGADPVERSFDGAGRIRVAGRAVAVRRGEDLEVYDRISGERRYGFRPDMYMGEFDVQDDGTVAYLETVERFEGEVAWASAAEPRPHSVGVRGGDGDIWIDGIANGRILFGRQHPVRNRWHIGVVGLDGGRLTLVKPHAHTGEMDFDGFRVTYSELPCTTAAIVIWDMTGTPPGQPRAECPPLQLASRDAAVDLEARTVSPRLACAAAPALGCRGNVTVWGRRPGSRREKRLAYDFVSLAPGSERAVALRLSRSVACSLVRDGDVASAKLQLESWGRDDGGFPRKVRRSLRLRGLSSCGG